MPCSRPKPHPIPGNFRPSRPPRLFLSITRFFSREFYVTTGKFASKLLAIEVCHSRRNTESEVLDLVSAPKCFKMRDTMTQKIFRLCLLIVGGASAFAQSTPAVHDLKVTPNTVHRNFFDASLKPVL